MSLQLANIFLPLIFLLCLHLGAAENTTAVIVVNQTPPSIRAMEGSEFTIECTFNTSNNSTKWFVEWYKTRNNVTEKLSNGTDRIRLSADIEKRSISLTVKKANVTDSGTYVCGVGSKDGISPGNGTQVTIDAISSTPVECCFNYMTGAIQLSKLVDFYNTPRECHLPAVVLETVADRKVCADPSKPWVKRAIRVLEAKRKQTSLS
ncbi:natural cytotoxicity triggering receptor 3-like [Chrysemys picta bellii]|uniref:natural cytotoxicity triggering receptor 3-like n=1 Tax=Chrysemys picta bellii TaxID=8478 RepID=UPI0032B0F99E